MKLNRLMIIGLGNPGYNNTRHNIGFSILDKLSSAFNLRFQLNKYYKSNTCKRIIEFNNDGNKDRIDVILLKPENFMNLSGISVQAAMKMEKLNPNQILVIHDDLERELGKFSLKLKGSANGHNGVSSIISSIATNEFSRLRVGIGRPESRDRDNISNYVLSKFDNYEQKIIENELWPKLNDYIIDYLKDKAK